MFCPSFASSRRPSKKGRREGRAPAGTRGPCARTCTRVDHRFRRNIRPSLRDGFTVSFVLSRVRRAPLPPSPCGCFAASRTGWYEAPPHDLTPASGARTTRLRRPRTSSLEPSTAGVCSPSRPCEDAVNAVSFTRKPCSRSTPEGFPPCNAPRARRRRVHRTPPAFRDDRDTPLGPGGMGETYANPKFW